jgi:hypothetical protein
MKEFVPNVLTNNNFCHLQLLWLVWSAAAVAAAAAASVHGEQKCMIAVALS